jgi:hypothetical protein
MEALGSESRKMTKCFTEVLEFRKRKQHEERYFKRDVRYDENCSSSIAEMNKDQGAKAKRFKNISKRSMKDQKTQVK